MNIGHKVCISLGAGKPSMARAMTLPLDREGNSNYNLYYLVLMFSSFHSSCLPFIKVLLNIEQYLKDLWMF